MTARRMREAAALTLRSWLHFESQRFHADAETVVSEIHDAIRSLPLPSPTGEDVRRVASSNDLYAALVEFAEAYASGTSQSRLKARHSIARAAIAAYEEGGE